jgi:hypothetical protein
MKLVFLLEEKSMMAALEELLPRLLPSEVSWICIAHKGKQDLDKSITRIIRRWTDPQAHFIVIRDQDSEPDCRALKQRLADLCAAGGCVNPLIRIACCELEAWFLGDLIAVERAMNSKGLAKRQSEVKFRDPDRLTGASQELRILFPAYNKVKGAQAIAQHMNLENNCSKSFNAFVKGMRRLLQEAGF